MIIWGCHVYASRRDRVLVLDLLHLQLGPILQQVREQVVGLLAAVLDDGDRQGEGGVHVGDETAQGVEPSPRGTDDDDAISQRSSGRHLNSPSCRSSPAR